MNNTIPTHREFKVARRSVNANGFGLHEHYLVAKDGQTFTACRSVGPWHTSSEVGVIFNVPLSHVGLDAAGDMKVAPDFTALGFEVPHELVVLQQYELVEKVWGKDVAEANTKGPTPKPAKAKKYVPSIRFEADEFKAYSDARLAEHEAYQPAGKAQFANHFVKFVERGFQQADFPKWFYTRLSNCFGHIAHYDQGGFWATFFESTATKVQFIEQAVEHQCYGQPEFTYSDVERVLRAWLRSQGVLQKLQQQLADEQQAAELALRDRLVAKHGPGVSADSGN